MTPIYAGIDASYRSRIPPTLPLWRGLCDECLAPIICHKPTIERHQSIWRERGIVLRIVCMDCCNRMLSERGGIDMIEFTPEVGRHFCRG